MTYLSGFQGLFNPGLSVPIASGDQASSVINCGGLVLCGIKIPAAFDGDSLTFQISEAADGTFQDLYVGDNNQPEAALSIAVTQGRWYALDPKYFSGVRFLKIVSSASESADRNLICQLRG